MNSGFSRYEYVASANESVTEYDYDCEGRLTNVWDANHPASGGIQVSTQYAYDALDRLKTVTSAPNAAPIFTAM